MYLRTSEIPLWGLAVYYWNKHLFLVRTDSKKQRWLRYHTTLFQELDVSPHNVNQTPFKLLSYVKLCTLTMRCGISWAHILTPEYQARLVSVFSTLRKGGRPWTPFHPADMHNYLLLKCHIFPDLTRRKFTISGLLISIERDDNPIGDSCTLE